MQLDDQTISTNEFIKLSSRLTTISQGIVLVWGSWNICSVAFIIIDINSYLSMWEMTNHTHNDQVALRYGAL